MKLTMSQGTEKGDMIKNFFPIGNLFNLITKRDVTRRNKQNIILAKFAYL